MNVRYFANNRCPILRQYPELRPHGSRGFDPDRLEIKSQIHIAIAGSAARRDEGGRALDDLVIRLPPCRDFCQLHLPRLLRRLVRSLFAVSVELFGGSGNEANPLGANALNRLGNCLVHGCEPVGPVQNERGG
jgi:hypothetical protein